MTALKGGDTPNDGNMVMELWYKFQVSDNISVTPALFYLSRPFGQLTGTSARYGGAGTDSFGTFGYLVKSTFRF
jgi:carbohydrate-selective porin OprB